MTSNLPKRTPPDHVHSFTCTGSSEAVTFHFRPDPETSKRSGETYQPLGWALATVNNSTGELTVQSDWGTWAHRWSLYGMSKQGGVADTLDKAVVQIRARHIPPFRRTTLIEFIAGMNPEWADYLADKLVSSAERNQFDEDRTVKYLKGELIRKRREDAQYVIDWYRGEDPEDTPKDLLNDESAHMHRPHRVWLHGREEKWPLTRDQARRLYDELDGLRTHTNDRDFAEAFWAIEGHGIVCDDMDFMRYSPSPHYYQLLHGILPAVVLACREHLAKKASAA